MVPGAGAGCPVPLLARTAELHGPAHLLPLTPPASYATAASARRRFGTSKEIVIDQSLMNKIGEVTGENPNSPETTYITMEGGLQLATAYEYLFKKHNLLIPGGSCWSVCAGGHVTGGGYGIYSRDHGTTCDFLAGVHFACACPRPRTRHTHTRVQTPTHTHPLAASAP